MSNSKQKYIKIYVLPIIIIGILTALDQLTKFIIVNNFELYQTKNVIKGILSFTYIRNEGIAWGMFQGKRYIFLVMTVIVLVFSFVVYNKIVDNKKFLPLRICIILLISGSIGNMIDRIKLGYVIDFLEVKFIDFPVFNVADIYVTLTMIAIFILIGFVYKDEDIELIFSKTGKSNKDGQ